MSQMKPCAGRNCGSTNPNLHSAECFEDYEKATGMAMTCPDCERYKQSAAMWRNKAYELGGTQLPWEPEELLRKEYERGYKDAIEAKLKEKNT